MRSTVILGLLCFCSWLESGQLPVRTYTTADGLPADPIQCLVRDPNGFLWICTSEGLSRFDGSHFTNYTVADGLPHRDVADVLVTRSGVRLIATVRGICRLSAPGTDGSDKKFFVYENQPAANRPIVNAFRQDHNGIIWAAADRGLYRVDGVEGPELHLQPVDLKWPDRPERVTSIAEDGQGTLWLGTFNGLLRRWPDGRVDQYGTKRGLPHRWVYDVLCDRNGRVWSATAGGLCLIAKNQRPGREIVERVFGAKDGLGADWIESLFETSEGKLWAGTIYGLSELLPIPDKQGHRFATYKAGQGITDRAVFAINEDSDGNLWIGSDVGLKRVTAHGLVRVSEAEGVGKIAVQALMEDARYGLYGIYSRAESLEILKLDRFPVLRVKPRYPRHIQYYGWGFGQIAFPDHNGEWWIATGQGLCRFPRVKAIADLSHIPPSVVYTSKHGLPSENIFRIYEDSRGDIWAGTIGPNTLARWERSSGRWIAYPEIGGMPSALLEDPSGAIWVGQYYLEPARIRHGKVEVFKRADGALPGAYCIFLDHLGRLWIGSGSALQRVDNPAADRPRFRTFTVADGLASDFVPCVTEDRLGRIYACTGRGIDRIDASGEKLTKIRHYTTADGLASGQLFAAWCDRRGVLWFGSGYGLSRLVPEPEHARSPLRVFLTGLRIAGHAYPMSEAGELEKAGLTLKPDQRNAQIDFVSPSFAPGEIPRYQFMLQGADRDWGPPTQQRTVYFANLAPGRYRFLVRTINSDGVASPQPATLAFEVLPPIWLRAWFEFLAVACVVGAAYGLYRYRVAKLLDVERIRMRIATDLHDDIGSSLSQIAILSEVASRRMREEHNDTEEALSDIGGISRELVDSMSDIVWSIDPLQDQLRDLVHRMRRFAGDVLVSRDIVLHFKAHGEDQDRALSADLRRQVFLVFKEAIHNVVRHSGATEAEINVEAEGGWLRLRVSDNGRGFESHQSGDGRGLKSMRERTRVLKGEVEIISRPGGGTVVWLQAPLGHGFTLWSRALHKWTGTNH